MVGVFFEHANLAVFAEPTSRNCTNLLKCAFNIYGRLLKK